jgi:hypothetical protein
MSDKIIVTNKGALVNKYDNNGFTKIGKALKGLIEADMQRGIVTKVVHIDNEEDMREAGNKIVRNALDTIENKEAIDAVFNLFNPDYLVILGSSDVIPHQDLKNPLFIQGGGGDEDIHVWSDLPYACEAAYSQDISRFIGVTRVLGRIPDLFGANEPSYLITLLKTASQYKSLPRQDYEDYLGLTADVWKGSTAMSIKKIFGNSQNLLLAPPSGPGYPNGQLHSRIHFINCHGATAIPEFYGQIGNDNYPVSLTTKTTVGEIVEGTVAAVECCYGAELYDSVTLSKDKPICQSYLEQGAYGYFGSTTIAYGPADSNGSADLICQYFLSQILNGASLGRAALLARQEYLGNASQIDAVDLKTIAQFYLLGDPSLQPITKPRPTDIPSGIDHADAERFIRAERREKMKQMGEFLSKTKPTASKKAPVGDLSDTAKSAISNIVKKAGLPDNVKITAFDIDIPEGIERVGGIKPITVPSRYIVAIGTPPGENKENIRRGVAVVAKEANGQIINYRIYHQR